MNSSGQALMSIMVVISLIIISIISYSFSKEPSQRFVNKLLLRKSHDIFIREQINTMKISLDDDESWSFIKSNNSTYACFTNPCTPLVSPQLIDIYDSLNVQVLDRTITMGFDNEHISCNAWTSGVNSTECIFRIEATVKSSCPVAPPCANPTHNVEISLVISEGESQINTQKYLRTVFK